MPKMTADEVKQAVLDAGKAMITTGLVEGTSGNVSGRLPDGNVVMTPSSVEYEGMTLDDLVVGSPDGDVLEGKRPPTTEKSLHLACMRQHEDIGAVMHSHAMFATMFAITHTPIPCVI